MWGRCGESGRGEGENGRGEGESVGSGRGVGGVGSGEGENFTIWFASIFVCPSQMHIYIRPFLFISRITWCIYAEYFLVARWVYKEDHIYTFRKDRIIQFTSDFGSFYIPTQFDNIHCITGDHTCWVNNNYYCLEMFSLKLYLDGHLWITLLIFDGIEMLQLAVCISDFNYIIIGMSNSHYKINFSWREKRRLNISISSLELLKICNLTGKLLFLFKTWRLKKHMIMNFLKRYLTCKIEKRSNLK